MRPFRDSLFAEDTSYGARDGWDSNDLLHPAQAFEHPSHVLNDPDLTLNEKRAILASWASDACALEAAPHLRCAPGVRECFLLFLAVALGLPVASFLLAFSLALLALPPAPSTLFLASSFGLVFAGLSLAVLNDRGD